MLVCHCNGVSDRAIRRAIRDGARTLGQVGQACGAGACCGGCQDSVRELLHVEGAEHVEESAGQVAPSAATA